MKRLVYVAGCLVVSVVAKGEVGVTTLNDIPKDRIAIAQPKVSESDSNPGNQSRYKGASDWRSAAQTFRWSSDESLETLGLYVVRYDNPSKRPQEYKLSIQELENGSSRKVVKTVFEETFTLAPKIIIPGKWVSFNVGKLPLEKQKCYAFVIGPATDISNQRADAIVFWGWKTGGHQTYADGYASQRNNSQLPSGFPPVPGVAYGGAEADMTFYMQTTE